jgi:hypothetical protein
VRSLRHRPQNSQTLRGYLHAVAAKKRS